MEYGLNSGSEVETDRGSTTDVPVVRMMCAFTLVVFTTTGTSAAIATAAALIP